MSNRTPARIRGAIIAVFTLLLLALILPNVSAQFRPLTPPGGGAPGPLTPPGGGAPGRPSTPQPTAPMGGNIPFGGNGGPGNIPGNGNFAGRPPTPNFPTVPEPRIPGGPQFENGIGRGDRPGSGGMPQPGGGTPYPGGGMPYPGGGMPQPGSMMPPSGMMPTPPMQPYVPEPRIPGGPTFENIWTCQKCGKEVGRGAFPPATCPHCGVQLFGGIGRGDPPTTNAPDYPSNPVPASSTTTSSGPSAGRILIIVAGIVTGIMILIIAAIILVVIISRNSTKKRPARRTVRRRRRMRDDDD